MHLSILFSNGTQQILIQNETVFFQWEMPVYSGSLQLSLDNISPCLLTDFRIYADDSNHCIITPGNGTAIGTDILVMEKNALIQVLIPENCTGRTLYGQFWITELPKDHPLPNRLITLAKNTEARNKAACKEIEALRSAGQSLVGAMTFPELDRHPGADTSEYAHLQELYIKTIHSTSWRITAPLRTVKNKIKMLKGPKNEG